MNDSIKVRNQYVTSFFRGALIVAVVIALAGPTASRAQVTMNASDGIGTSGFNAAGHWSDTLAPHSGTNYSTLGFLLRTPAAGLAFTFAGDSLTVGGGSGAAAFSPLTPNNNALIYKLAFQTITVTNLILDGSQIRDGNGEGQWAAINGDISVTANGGAFMAQATNVVNAALHGSSVIYIGDNGNGSLARAVVFTSGLNTFNGNLVLTNSGNNATRAVLALAPGSLWNFKPLANGVNNTISGTGNLRLAGNFAIDLTGADNTLGDTWQLVGTSNATFNVLYDGTFGVNGFTQSGSLWDASANGVTYEFDQGTGLLTVVPEPSTMALVGLGIAALVLRRKRNRA